MAHSSYTDFDPCRWPMLMPADTAVGAVTMLSADAAEKALREQIENLADDGELSQRAFWRFYDNVQGGRQPDICISDGQGRILAIELKAN